MRLEPVTNQANSKTWWPRLAILFVGLTAFFYSTAPKTTWTSDPLLNSITAWNLANTGTFVLDSHKGLLEPSAFLEVTWVMPGVDGPVSIFPPGTALLAAPVYALGWGSPQFVTTAIPPGGAVTYLVPPLEPGALVASVTTAAAVMMLAILFSRLADPGSALVGAVVFALGTGAWSVASQALWQHGPAMMWIALGLLYPYPTWAALAWLPAVLTRPHVAAIPFVGMGYESIRDRQWRKTLLPVAATSVGAILFLAYNRFVFGSWSPFAAYELNPVLTLADLDLLGWLINLGRAFLDPQRGMIFVSPFLLILVPGLRAAWKSAPTWVKAAALGGVAFWLIQYKAHDYRGGDRFFGYRFALEGLLATSPLLFLSYQGWVQNSFTRKLLFSIGVAFAVTLQAIGVMNPFAL